MKDHAGKYRGRLLVENRLTETEQDTKGEIEGQRNLTLTRSRNQPEGQMPGHPDQSRDDSCQREGEFFLQSRLQEAPPAQLFVPASSKGDKGPAQRKHQNGIQRRQGWIGDKKGQNPNQTEGQHINPPALSMRKDKVQHLLGMRNFEADKSSQGRSEAPDEIESKAQRLSPAGQLQGG